MQSLADRDTRQGATSIHSVSGASLIFPVSRDDFFVGGGSL